MTYFEKATKKQLRDYQRKATITRNEGYALRYKTALVLWDELGDIRAVAKYFGVTRDAAYKMVRKGKELKSVSKNTSKPRV